MKADDGASGSTTIADVLPSLVAARLESLPARMTPSAEAEEAARLAELRELFAAGADLASKLDARSKAFLDPSTAAEARDPALKAADKAAADSRAKLDKLVSPALPSDGAAGKGASAPAADARPASLWPGYAKGELIDAGAGAAAAAASSGVDLLVTGRLELRSGYAAAEIEGYDRSLDRRVFLWRGACSLEDPEPLADEIAARLERWVAGRDFARLEVRASPSSARVKIDGREFSQSRVVYLFAPGDALVEADSAGFLPFRETVALDLGERRSLEIALQPRSLGTVLVVADPPGARLSVDSMPAGEAPASIVLDGTRGILSASAEGRESVGSVLPASGDSTIELILPPSDGLGPAGRVEAARKDFFKSLGWLVVAIPPTVLSAGAYSLYSEADRRSPLGSTSDSRVASGAVLAAAAAGTAVASVNMIIHLVKYLRAAR